MKYWNYLLTTLFVAVFLMVTACSSEKKEIAVQPMEMHNLMQQITDVIVHDIFSPPVAARIYSYSSIAAYEVLSKHDSVYAPLAGQLNDFQGVPAPHQEIQPDIAALQSMYLVGKALVFSEDKMEDWNKSWKEDVLNRGIDETVFQNSLQYADTVAKYILAWANEDNYKETRTMSKHSLSNEPHHWEPTPPAYMEAIEPHWNLIRPFALDSSNQFIPEKPTPFSLDSTSQFYKEVMEVYDAVKDTDKEKEEIAGFWDCNPYVMNVQGHVMFATKKITPGGHWMGITKIACQLDSASLIKSAQAYALTAISINDAFISCWDEKFRSNLIRPETVINRHIDEDWKPILQTPPFPEYTSGHSMISSAAALALTELFGKDFHFVDSTEVKYGLPVRSYDSFILASEEAAISRLYGGIHYMPAINNGIKEGRAIGDFIVGKLDFHRQKQPSDKISQSNIH
ncbi:vanadium-dependent haloperoxidase [Marivirga sp. S37H4]|uniref:Vanadium-dependent haloperoxidase n=2 Tax=Marivirga aurantiaca TaxID=2802615 RepID=A0A934X0U7_9BACT|nr:vanadium-dependent haloperoxidase [Marivirga aurantiaca]